MKSTCWGLMIVLLAAAVVPAAADAREGESVVGRVHYQTPGLDVPKARGEVFEADAVVSTQSEWAIVHLDNGRVLRLDANSAALFEPAAYGDVQVRVLSGMVRALSDAGEPLEAGAGSRFVIGPSSADPMGVEALLLRVPTVRPRRR